MKLICDQCKEVPCAIWRATRDPKFTDEEFEANVEGRINALKNML